MKHTISFIIITMILISGCAFLSSCGAKEEDTTKDITNVSPQTVILTEAQFKNAEIQFGKLENRNLSNVVQCNGVLDVPPQNLISISLPVGGILKTTELLQGMKVQKGQVIAVFEHPDYIQMQQEYIQTKANLEYQEAEYRRQEELSRENVSSQKTFQKMKAEYLSLKAQLSGLQKKLDMMGISVTQLDKGNMSSSVTVVSPINGYVTKVNVNIGKYVSPNDVVFEIVDTEHLHAELTVYEKDITKIKVGQTIRFSLSNESGEERLAKVHLIGREITAERTVRIHGHLEIEDTELLPGMYIKAVIETGEQKMPSLPEAAVVQSEGKNYIFLRELTSQQTHAFKMTEVKTGIRENGFIEIMPSESIQVGSDIVVKGAYDLLAKLFNTSEEE